jgi:hypothetical protein
MRFRWRCRPVVESLDSRTLLSGSSFLNSLPGVSLFQNVFGKKTKPTSVLQGSAIAGPDAGEFTLVGGYGHVYPLGIVSQPAPPMANYVQDLTPSGSVATVSLVNTRGVFIATVALTASGGATLSGSRQAFDFTETHYFTHGRGVRQETIARVVSRGKANLSFPNGSPTPGGPPVKYNLVMQSLT